MITHTFSFLPGIGNKLEKRLWKSGILSWEDFLAARSIPFLSMERKKYYDDLLERYQRNLEQGGCSIFKKDLKQSDHWRLFPLLRDRAVALDIETTGGAPGNSSVTVVGLYDGFDYTALLKGRTLNRQALEKELSRYSYIITFYGTFFDLPYLRDMCGLHLPLPHFDLCFSGRKVGLRGGLKKIEESLGIQRDASVRGFDGFTAVRLWQEAERGRNDALELLLTYNRCDTVNLFVLADVIYDRLIEQSGIAEYLIGYRDKCSYKPDQGQAYGS